MPVRRICMPVRRVNKRLDRPFVMAYFKVADPKVNSIYDQITCMYP